MLSPRPAKTAGYWPIFGHPLKSHITTYLDKWIMKRSTQKQLCPVKLWHPQIFCNIQSYVSDATKTAHIYDNNEMHHTRTFSLNDIWLFCNMWCSFRTCLSSRGRLRRFLHLKKNRSELILSFRTILYLRLISSAHADSSMADKKHGKQKVMMPHRKKCSHMVWNNLVAAKKIYSIGGKKNCGCCSLLGRAVL